MKHIEFLGGRKFIMAAGCGLVSSVLVWFGKISGAEYEVITLGTVGAFIAGNVWQGRTPAATDRTQ